MIEVCTVGGYNEVGKNMTAVKVDDEVVILDMGLHLDTYIRYTEDEDIHDVTASALAKVGAVPNDMVIEDWRAKVKAIIPTHAHLDHVGALIFLSNKYKAPILCTPFTAEVIKAISADEKIRLRNPIKKLNVNSTYHISKHITVEFINITHSTPHTVMVALHTPEGTVLYANDFKFDNHPVIGNKPNYKRLEEIGKKGLHTLIVDCTRAKEDVKTPSEMVAKEMLKDVMLGTENRDKIIIVTTFSSHLARLKSIIEFGKHLRRKIIFLGRSLAKYVEAGERAGVIQFSKQIEMVRYSNKIQKRLKQIKDEDRHKYLLVITGHQGEPKATLSKIARKEIPFPLYPEDHIIFSCNIIPSPVNIENRARLEEELHRYKVRIFKGIHVSGHAAREDLRDLLNLVKPQHIIPAHGDKSMHKAFAELAVEKGYVVGKTVHLMSNGDRVRFD
ncbi:RNase J family beta-CASP ribonuclease [Candidatus Woesearchaeota archaeon]|nr:RNase J family beta-CASP ribonuclease [Candidatus Woesearchaeota archaeon]